MKLLQLSQSRISTSLPLLSSQAKGPQPQSMQNRETVTVLVACFQHTFLAEAVQTVQGTLMCRFREADHLLCGVWAEDRELWPRRCKTFFFFFFLHECRSQAGQIIIIIIIKKTDLPLSPAALFPSSSRLTWVITEDGWSITSRSGPERWPHTSKLEIVRCWLGAAWNQLNTYEDEAPRETSQQVAYSTSITLRGCCGPARCQRPRQFKVWKLGEKKKTFDKEMATLIQYGAQLRSQFQDTNMEVSRLPISLKVVQ